MYKQEHYLKLAQSNGKFMSVLNLYYKLRFDKKISKKAFDEGIKSLEEEWDKATDEINAQYDNQEVLAREVL